MRSAIFAGLIQKKADTDILRRIVNKHLSDTAQFVNGSTDVVITWSVKEYMQMLMNSEACKKQTEVNFKERLEKMRHNRCEVKVGARHGIISKDSLLRIENLTCACEWAQITSFTLITQKKAMVSGNNVLTQRMKRTIRRLRSGERVSIENIKVVGPDKMTRILNSVRLKVV